MCPFLFLNKELWGLSSSSVKNVTYVLYFYFFISLGVFLQEGTLNSLPARHRPLEHKGTTHREYEYNSITLNESTTNKTGNKKVIFAGFVATRKISTIYNYNYAFRSLNSRPVTRKNPPKKTPLRGSETVPCSDGKRQHRPPGM